MSLDPSSSFSSHKGKGGNDKKAGKDTKDEAPKDEKSEAEDQQKRFAELRAAIRSQES